MQNKYPTWDATFFNGRDPKYRASSLNVMSTCNKMLWMSCQEGDSKEKDPNTSSLHTNGLFLSELVHFSFAKITHPPDRWTAWLRHRCGRTGWTGHNKNLFKLLAAVHIGRWILVCFPQEVKVMTWPTLDWLAYPDLQQQQWALANQRMFSLTQILKHLWTKVYRKNMCFHVPGQIYQFVLFLHLSATSHGFPQQMELLSCHRDGWVVSRWGNRWLFSGSKANANPAWWPAVTGFDVESTMNL